MLGASTSICCGGGGYATTYSSTFSGGQALGGGLVRISNAFHAHAFAAQVHFHIIFRWQRVLASTKHVYSMFVLNSALSAQAGGYGAGGAGSGTGGSPCSGGEHSNA